MTFPLLPYSQLVFDMMGEVPDVYDSHVVLRVRTSDVDLPRLESAIRTAIRNHPVLSMILDSHGHHPYDLSDELHGLYHSVDITHNDGSIQLSVHFNRILGDMTSLIVLADDISKAYQELELEPDNYQDYLKKYHEFRSSVRYEYLKKWFDSEFSKLSYPVRPHTDSALNSTEFGYFGFLNDSIPYSEALLHSEHITLSGFVSLCTALAIMDYEGTDAAALTWAYSGRDSLEEQRIFGSLHKDIPFVIRRAGLPAELFRQTRSQLRSGIAHSDYPYTLMPPENEVWNYAVNVLQQPDPGKVFESFPFHIEMEAPVDDAPQIAYSLLDIEITGNADESVCLLYKYSEAHYTEESMERFTSLVRSNAEWLLSGHHRVTHRLEEIASSDAEVAQCLDDSIAIAAEHCPDRRMNPVRSISDLYSFLDRFLVSKPWESLGLGEELSLFRRIDQSTGYFLYLFDQPLKQLEGKGYLYPSVQFVPVVSQWIKDFNNAWREYLDSPDSWDSHCLELVSADHLFGMDRNWYESPDSWKCWNDFFSRRLSAPSARPLASSTVIAPVDGVLQDIWTISGNNCLSVPEGIRLKTASILCIADLLADSPYRDCFAGGLFVHQMLDFYDYHRLHSPVDGTVLDVRTVNGISGSGGVVIWNAERGRYEYANPGEPGFQMLETRGVTVIDTGSEGLVALVAVGMAQVCSVNWLPELQPGCSVRKGDELGFFLCGGSDVVMLFQKDANLHPTATPGTHLLMGESLFNM